MKKDRQTDIHKNEYFFYGVAFTGAPLPQTEKENANKEGIQQTDLKSGHFENPFKKSKVGVWKTEMRI